MVSPHSNMSDLRAFLLVLVLIAALAAEEASAGADPGWGFLPRLTIDSFGMPPTCNHHRIAGGCIEAEEEEAQMESETARRVLAAAARRYISYGALNKNRVPCSVRGQSYYNCRQSGHANPYRRGCSVITRCKRIIN